jgi:ABC-2 type transport system ATP-binding protein
VRPTPRAVVATSAVALVAGTAGLTGLAGPAAAAGPDVTRTEVTLTVRVGPTDTTVCTVDADLYVPAGVDAANPAPAVLTTNGFGGSKDDQAGAARALGREGYVTLSYTGLGFPDSGCKITLDDPDYDGKAAKQLVDYLAGRKADDAGRTLDMVALDAPGDPKVGMIGGSYGGQVQFAAASLDPRIDALIPIITWNDLAYSLAPNNTSLDRGVTYATPGVHKKQWTSLFFGVGIADGVQGSTVDPSRNVGCPNFATQACLSKAQLETLGYPDQATLDFARHASVASYVEKVSAPTLLVQGQKDTLFNLQEAAATYSALQRQGTPVQMIWQSWGHSLGGTPAPGELDLSGGSDLRATYLGGRFLDWFDHYVKGDATASTGPEFAYFRDWVGYTGNAAPAYATADAYPVGSPLRLFLSGGKALVTKRSAVVDGTQSWANAPGGAATSYSETSSQGGNDSDPLPPSDAPGTFAEWTSAPFTTPTVTVGTPTLKVRLDSPAAERSQAAGPAGQLVVFAKLYDVAPDGTQTLRHRLVSPVRVADVTQPFRIELPGVVQRWAEGHRLRLVLAASDAAYAGNAAVLPVSVTADPDDPAVLTLPVVSGRGPGTPAPQPARPAGASGGAGSDAAGGSGAGADAGTGPQDGAAQGAVRAGATGTAGRVDSAALASTGPAPGALASTGVLGLVLLAGGGALRRSARGRGAGGPR